MFMTHICAAHNGTPHGSDLAAYYSPKDGCSMACTAHNSAPESDIALIKPPIRKINYHGKSHASI